MAKQNKPAIRFKGFTDAWEQRKLGELVEIGDIDHRMPETVADGIPYLMTGDFCGTNELNFNSVKMISENDYRQLSQKIKPEQGDIIFARYASVGAARYVDFTRKFLISYSCAIIKQSKKIDSKYLYHFITSASAQKQIKIEINTGSQANIGIDSMKNNIIVDMPLPEEQRKIGIFLTQIDHLITLHQRKYDKLQVLKKALLEKMFPKNGSSVPEIRFKGFTDAWEQRKLGEVVERITRKNENLESTLPLTISAQYGLINQNEFFDKRIASKDVSGYFLVRNGEFAYNKSTSSDAPWGAIKRLDSYESGVLSTLYIVFKILDERKTSSDYIVTYYNTDLWHKGIQAIAAEGARNHGLLNVAPADFFETNLTMPKDYAEQQQIGSFFQQLDHLITLHQRELEKLQNIKKSMLEKMFV